MGNRRPVNGVYRCQCWVWSLVILILSIVILGLLIGTVVILKQIRADVLPHCYRVFGTGPDVIPGPGEADPFHPHLGAMIKGEIEVGDICLRWDIVCFNLTSPATAMAIHGMLLGNDTTAPVFINMGVERWKTPRTKEVSRHYL